MLLNTLEIRLEPNMEQATVMLNAPMTSNLFVARLTAKTGKMIRDTMEAAVLNLMFGRLTSLPMHTQPMSALLQDTIDVKEMNVEMMSKDKMETVIKMVAI